MTIEPHNILSYDGDIMKYSPDIHHRQSIRLKKCDYSKPHCYFLTICTENRENLFGAVVDNSVSLNNAGKMIENWIIRAQNKFQDVIIEPYVIMPNHFHGIFRIVGADLCVCPGTHEVLPNQGEHMGSPLQSVVQWFKTMTTNEYIAGVKNGHYPSFNRRIWQRNYYDHIIHSEAEYQTICKYIHENPLKWKEDIYFL